MSGSTIRRNMTALLLWCAAAAMTTAALVLYARGGAQVWQVLLVWCAAAAGAYLPGVLLARLCRTQVRGPLRFVLHCVLGGAFFALLTVAACLTGLHWLAPAITALLCALWVVDRVRRARAKAVRRVPEQLPWLALIVAVCVLLNALWSLRYTHPTVAGSLIPSQDFFWNLGNVQSFLQGFPPEDLRVAEVTVTYHYLTELLQAGLILLTGAPAYDVVAFAAYAPVAAGMVGCMYALGTQLWGHGSSRALALSSLPLWMGCASLWKALEAGGSRFGNMLLIHVVSNINGQATAFLFLAAFLTVFHALEQASWRAGALLPVCGIAAFFLLTFSKGPQAALLALALTAAVLVRLLVCALTRQRKKPAPAQIAVPAAVCLGFWPVYGGLFSAGADSSMAFSLTGTVELHFFGSILNAGRIALGGAWPLLLAALWLAQAFCMAPAGGLAFCLGALRDIRRVKELSLSVLMLYAAIPGGLLAFFLFDHYSSSQIYFASIALFFLGILLLRELPALWARRSRFGRLCRIGAVALLAVGVLTGVCQTVYLVQSAAAVRDPSVATNKLPLTAAEETGCGWLRDNAEEGELFATNRMHTGSSLEGLSNVYSGLSGRQAYCESIKYALSNMGDQTGDIIQRYERMEELFRPDTTPQRVQDICTQYGITYVLYHTGSPGSNIPLQEMQPVFVSEDLIIYRVQ